MFFIIQKASLLRDEAFSYACPLVILLKREYATAVSI